VKFSVSESSYLQCDGLDYDFHALFILLTDVMPHSRSEGRPME
jgi:hypothetical protein